MKKNDKVFLKSSGAEGVITDIIVNPFVDEEEIWVLWSDTNEKKWVYRDQITLKEA
ncbi:hypothetical protein [Bacillus thuringiensis]|uniref:hypothetical protein n=1 Tax=Bacillus thuringiensis TaxID=1428 RepID=UPI00159BA68E|nr:hypothetical protein [Bacillus thuringiensis]